MTEKRTYTFWMNNFEHQTVLDSSVIASSDKGAKRIVSRLIRTEMQGGVRFRFGRWKENELGHSDWKASIYVEGRWAYYVHLKKGDIAV